MNHIYKVIWNTITQTWVAVSELSRAKGKTKSSKTLSAVVLAAVSAGAIVGDAEAAINYPTGSVYGTEGASDGMAIGLGSVAHGDSVSYGVSAQGNNRWGVTIGSNAKSGALNLTPPSINDGAVAVGAGSSAEHFGATAIGPKAKAGSGRATAVGTQAEALGENSVALGQGSKAEKAYGVALGKSANAKEQLGIAVGKNASAENFLSTAVGAKTQAKGESSIAIGSGDLAGGTDLDAPEGAKATGNASMAVGASAKATADNATALGKKATASGRDSIAAGATANASGTDSIATGHNANATGANAVATGANASAAGNAAAYGDNSQATGGWSSAFGNESKATATDASAFGNSANVSTQNGTAIGSHSTVTAINGTALGNQAEVTSAGGVALGQGSKTTNKDGTARQGLNKDSYQIVRVSNDQNSKDYNKFQDGGFSYSDKDTPDKVYAPVKLVDAPGALEAIKDTIRGSTGPVSIGNQGTTRQLINVAPGSADSDAVNVAQLKAVAGAIKHYDVVSPNGDITVTHPDPHDPNKTVWNLNLNPDRVKEITKWKLRDVEENGNPKAGQTDALVKGDETVTFQDTDTIDVERVGKDGKTLKFHTKKNIKYFSVNSSGGTNEDNKGATVDGAIAIGKNASSTGSNAVSLGLGANASGANNTAIGPGAQAKDVRTTAIGYNAKAEAASAVGIGYEANATHSRSVAIGQDATASANNAIALGSSGQQSGNDRPNKTTASAEHAVAIGSGAEANIANGIALGSGSKTTAPSGQTGFDASTHDGRANHYSGLNGKTLTSNLAGLSIGNGDKTRQINHLAAGKEDDDAVNVAQLKSVNLAFKGNSGSGDVRLHDQRLSVVGDKNSFITTTASGGELKINTTKSNELQFTAGAANNITTPTGLTTDKAVANAINNSGWTLQAGDKTVGLINPGDKVNIASGKGITVTSTPEANNISKITINATVAGIKAGHNVTVDTDKNGISTISAIDTITTVKGKDGSAAKVTTATGSNNTNKIYEVDINVDDTTISKAGGTLHAVTGAIEEVTTTTTGDNAKKKGQVQAKSGDGDKVTTVSNVAEMINKAKWFAKAENNEDEVTNKTDDSNSDGQAMSAGDKLTLKAGKNLSVNRTDGVFTFALNKAVDLTKDGSLTIGETKVDNGGITITPTNPGEGKTNVTLTANGLDNGGNKIVNVAAGENDNDAVNYKQLKDSISTESVAKAADAEGDTNIANVTVDGNKKEGDKGAKYLVSVSEKAVKKAARDAIDVKGTNFISATSKVDGDVETHTVTATTNAVTMTAEGKANTPTATGLTTNKDVADAINASGWKISQGDTSKGIVNPGNEVSFKGGEGTEVTVSDATNGKRTVTITSTVKPNEKGVIEEVTANGTGENAPKKGQVQAKSGDGDKVTTVSNVAEMINKAKWFAKAENNEDEVTNKTDDSNSDGQAMSAGDKLTLKAGKNLSVNRTDGVFTFALNKAVDLTKDGSLTIGETKVDNGGITITPTNPGEGKTNVTLTANGLDNGGNKIVNVAEGTKDTDAVNVKQLKSTELHIAPTKANGKASDVTYTYDDKTKSVTLKYKDGNGNDIENTEAKIDLSGLASKIKDYSFKTNATGSNLVGTGTDTTVASGKSVNFAASDNLTLKQDVNDGNVTYTYGLKNQVVVGEKGTPGADGKPGKDGIDGSIGVNGKDGSAVAINGKDGSIGLNGKDGKNGLTIKGQDGKVGVDGKDGETRLVYVEKADPTKPGSSDKTHELATLDDGMKYGGDIGEVANVKLNKQVDIKGGVTDKTKLSDNNIGVISTPNATTGGTELTVKLAKELKGLTSAEFKDGDSSAVTNITNSGITIKPANSNDDNKTVSLTDKGLNNGGNTITNVAEGKNDTDAVNVKQLKDFKSEVAEGGLTFAGNSGDAHKAKLNSTVNIKGGEGNTDADQFDNGKNVMTKVNGNTVTVSIKKTPEVEGINIIDTTGKVKVKLTQTDEGLKVSDGNNNATRITNVKAGENDTDAVNVKQLNAAKTKVTAGDNIDVTSSTDANGQTIYKVSAKGINDTSAEVKAGSNHVEVTKAANTHKDGSTTVTDYTVDLSKETKDDIKKGVDAHTKVTTEGLTFNADKGTTTGVKKLGSSVAVNGDGKNITTSADENGVKVSMKDDIKVNSVTAKEVKVGDVNINENGINAGDKRITNVAPGKDGTDAVNVNQLKYVAGNISNQINNVDKGLRAGIAGALASGGLYHVTTAGKSMVSVGAGTYRGQNALAVGYSRLSDNGKVGVKFTVNSNSQGHAGASASVGYQW
ncbi:ESPR-type extended signal peptide-containing protein [Haemophilus haemolyticus]|uniref:ESPR-type extended signal peptide-containing protein n=1 Tax=Haemophilus haemolyticus TaxID=726 RepID=UPI000E573A76|nr:ESPR-type extended signal peptide-containing protein [Haemophilus haemolyticus]